MIFFSKFKVFTAYAVCILGFIFMLPNVVPGKYFSFLPNFLQKTVNLGLDLRGGSHIQLEVDTKTATKDYLTNLISETRKELRKNKIGYTGLKVVDNSDSYSLSFTLVNHDQFNLVKKIIQKVDKVLIVNFSDGVILASPSKESFAKRNSNVISQSIEVVRRRIDESGTREPIIQREGRNRIIVQLPGVDNPDEIKRLLGKTAKLSFHWVDETLDPIYFSEDQKVNLPIAPVGIEYLLSESRSGLKVYLPVKKNVIINGENLSDAQVSMHEGVSVGIKFNNIGAKQMAEASKNINKQFAIVLDNVVISAPVFREQIPSGDGSISGHFSIEEANELALLLRAGALPAPLSIVEECTIGPSLGSDSISFGIRSVFVAFLFVASFMILVYAKCGVIANICLSINLMLLLASLSILQATLTLPGIAGIAITIGMAVDANVLIFERIKEELRIGLSLLQSIEHGYSRAITAIIDSNLTTLIGAWFLYYFGNGSVKGFAVTLTLGTLISMFTALTLTQMILVTWIRIRKIKTLKI